VTAKAVAAGCRRDVTDRGDEHRGENRADTAQRLHRLIAGMTLEARWMNASQ
jgi:hypothetical protein